MVMKHVENLHDKTVQWTHWWYTHCGALVSANGHALIVVLSFKLRFFVLFTKDTLKNGGYILIRISLTLIMSCVFLSDSYLCVFLSSQYCMVRQNKMKISFEAVREKGKENTHTQANLFPLTMSVPPINRQSALTVLRGWGLWALYLCLTLSGQTKGEALCREEIFTKAK